MIAPLFLIAFALALSTPAVARDAPWLVTSPALAQVGTAIAGPGARIETKDDDEEAVTAYCKGLGAQTPDALLITRRLLDREQRSCATEAIATEPERVLGIIGLAIEGAPPGVTRRHLWRAFAKEISDNGKLAPNRARSWREIDPSFPDRPIALRLAVPAPLVDTLVLAPGCLGAAGYAKLDRKRLCRGLRDDVADGPDPVTILPLGAPGTPIEGMAATEVEISAGRYPLARRVYMYLKRPHLPGIPGLSGLQSRGAAGLLASP